MRIDVLDKAHFRIFEDNMSKIVASIHRQIHELKGLVYQLQDRIKILEDKDGLKTDK